MRQYEQEAEPLMLTVTFVVLIISRLRRNNGQA